MLTSNAPTRPQAIAALREMARALSAAFDLTTTHDLIARKTTEVMHVDSCTIYLLDPDGQNLRLMATTGLARRALGRSVLKVGEGMTGFAVRENRPVYSANARTNPHFKMVDGAEELNFRSRCPEDSSDDGELGPDNARATSSSDESSSGWSVGATVKREEGSD
jgi:hypothetical protein